jgi:hypothetical protein
LGHFSPPALLPYSLSLSPSVPGRLNKTFSKEEVKIVKKQKKKCSPSLAIKETKSKSKPTEIPLHSC